MFVKMKGSTGDKAPSGVTNHSGRTRKDVVQAAESEKRQTFTAKLLDAQGNPPPNKLEVSR